MLTSHAFRPRTSVRSRNAAVDSAFVYPSYRGRVVFNYRVLYVVNFFFFCGPFLAPLLFIIYLSCDIYSRSLLILVASYPLLPLRRSPYAALVLHLLLQQLPYFLFLLYSPQAKGLLAYKLQRSAPLGGPRSSYTIQCLAYLLLYRVVLYHRYSLYSGCLYIYVYRQYCSFALQRGAWCPFIGPCDFMQILVLQFFQRRQGAFCQWFAVQPYALDLGAVQYCRPYNCCIQQLCASKGRSLG